MTVRNVSGFISCKVWRGAPGGPFYLSLVIGESVKSKDDDQVCDVANVSDALISLSHSKVDQKNVQKLEKRMFALCKSLEWEIETEANYIAVSNRTEPLIPGNYDQLVRNHYDRPNQSSKRFESESLTELVPLAFQLEPGENICEMMQGHFAWTFLPERDKLWQTYPKQCHPSKSTKR